jgi:hypothetical protein
MSKEPLILDSSKITTFLFCPQKSSYMNQGLIPSNFNLDEDQIAMNAGTYGHKLLELYYKNRARGMFMTDNINSCYAYNPDIDTCECGCPLESHYLIAALNLRECKKCTKCLNFKAKPFPLPIETRQLVLRRFNEYVLHYNMNGAQDFCPINENTIEVGFSEIIYEDNENLFILEGRIDMLATLQGLKVLVDHKFQLQTHYLYPKSVQFKNYALISKSNTLVINYVRLQQKIQPTSLYREAISFSSIELAAWKKTLIDIFWKVKESRNSGAPEKNWASCSGYGKTFDKDKPKYCWYDTLCNESDAAVLARKKSQLFKIQEKEWRPW